MESAQLSILGFDVDVKGSHLMNFLETEVGTVLKCRMKTLRASGNWFPDLDMSIADVIKSDDHMKVVPHAFVHFATHDSVGEALSRKLFLDSKPLTMMERSDHVKQRQRTKVTEVPYEFSDVVVEIGNFTRQGFAVAWSELSMNFLVDPFGGTCKFCFTKDTVFSSNVTKCVKHKVLKCDYKIEFLVSNINHHRYTDTNCDVILLQLSSRPSIWYRMAADEIVKSVSYDLFDDDDPWIRTTDFTVSRAIGRCSTYKVSIPHYYHEKLNVAMKSFLNQKVQTTLTCPPKIWNEQDYGVQMKDHFFSLHVKDIPFETLFLVNAIIHKGIINQHQMSHMSHQFFELLKNQPNEVNLAALRHIYAYKCPILDVLDACKKLKLEQERLLKTPRLCSKEPVGMIEIKRLVITPTTAYCLLPVVELSNRVLRRYKEVSDRFLRVSFKDDGMKKINSHVFSYYDAPILKKTIPSMTKIYERTYDIVENGFCLCGRKYSFLAYSSSQLRDQSAWFFAETKNITVENIISWMGNFTDCIVGKYAARMGLCFSSTYATVEVSSDVVNHNLPDVERNGYVFSDGIGTITFDLAVKVAEMLKINGDPPSAYQIRYGGYKGVVAHWPVSKEVQTLLALRPSMKKFESDHNILEICSWTKFQPSFLNRQIITLLSTLGVKDDVFLSLLKNMVSKLKEMIDDRDVALDVVSTFNALEQDVVTTFDAHKKRNEAATLMLRAGFEPRTELHLKGMLMSIKAEQLSSLQSKARIFVDKGRCCMGCFDESGVLQGGQCFIQVSNESLFPETKNDRRVVTGTVVIAKNPCLHPGDIRILTAVDFPQLHHLYDCLVFPKNGERPHTNEASGSDLDGDLYFVTWDENLIPPKCVEPMEYKDEATEVEVKKNAIISHGDIKTFFTKNMIKDNMGTICNAHVVHADLSNFGASNKKCHRLAKLASDAVDCMKTGKEVIMPKYLKPKSYPDFMEKTESNTYKSKNILGKLYRKSRQLRGVDDTNISTSNEVYYDEDLEVAGAEDFIDEAWNLKCSYDCQLSRLLERYHLKREEEIVFGYIWSMSKNRSREQKLGEMREMIKLSYSTLKKEFRDVFETVDSGGKPITKDERKSLYEMKASAWYKVAYHSIWLNKSRGVLKTSPMFSFPWIAGDYLLGIKTRKKKV